MYIYIYICIYEAEALLRPVSLLMLSLLRLVDSNVPGDSLMDMRIPSLHIKILNESNPLKSRILVWRLAVMLRRYRAALSSMVCHMLHHTVLVYYIIFLEGTQGVPRNGGRKQQLV